MNVKLKQAVILAGGKGERLRPLTEKIPKPMVIVNGNPFLDYLLDSLLRAGITKILFLVGYRGQAIRERYGDSFGSQLQFEYSMGSIEDDTGKRILDAHQWLEDHFLLVYGDNYWPIDLDSMVSWYQRSNAMISTTVFGNKDGTGEYGWENNVEVGDDGYVNRYDKKRKSPGLNGVDIGYFLVSKKALNFNIKENISFEQDILPEIISKKQLVAYTTDVQYWYITNLASLRSFESYVCQNNISHLRLG